MRTWSKNVLWVLGLLVASQLGGCACGDSSGGGILLPAIASMGFIVEPTTTSAGSVVAPGVAVELRDASGAVIVGSTARVTLAMASNPTGASLGGTLSLNAVDGVATFPDLSMTVAGSGYTLRAFTTIPLPTDGGGGGEVDTFSQPFDILAGPASQLFVAGVSARVRGGKSYDFYVDVTDDYDNLITDYTGTVGFGSTDPLASLPADYTFTTGDMGSHTFVDGVTFMTRGPQDLVGADISDPNLTGSQVDIDVLMESPRVEGIACYTDTNQNAQVDAGDFLIVPFDQNVTVSGATTADFVLPVQGDSFGTGATVVSGADRSEVRIVLGTGASLTSRLTFDQADISFGAPSGVDVSPNVTPGVIFSTQHLLNAVPSVPVDVYPTPFRGPQVFLVDDTFSVAAGDLDCDGDLDWISGNHGANHLWRNDGNLAVSFASSPVLGSSSTSSLVLGDLDGDGDLDAVEGVDGAGSPNLVWLNDGNGGFTSTGQGLGSGDTRDVALADLDRDGNLDLLEANDDQGARVYLGDGTGMFTDTGASLGSGLASSLALGDVDADGDVDLVIGIADVTSNLLYLNDGTGDLNVSAVTLGTLATHSVVLVDADGDGDLDLIEGNAGANLLWHNQGGAFTDSGQRMGSVITESIVTADLDEDGDADLSVVNGNEDNSIWVNLDGTFVRFEFVGASGGNPGPGGTSSAAQIVADLDGEGDLDILYANRGPARNRVFFGAISGAWGLARPLDSQQSLGASVTREVLAGDLDRDGDLDLVSLDQGANKVYRGDGTGSFSDSGQSLGANDSLGGVLVDADGDGDLDLAAANDMQSLLWMNSGSGAFTAGGNLETGNSVALVAGDLNGDGALDLVFGKDGPSAAERENAVWLGDGAGAFTRQAQTLGSDATAALVLDDLDCDGDLDLMEVHAGGTSLWFNDGGAGFTLGGQSLAAGLSGGLGDLDDDGDPDAFVGGSGTVTVYLNDGAGGFGAPVATLTGTGDFETLRVADFDGNRLPDVFGCASTDACVLWKNQGGGSFATGLIFGGGSSTRSLGLGDFDRDGDTDLAGASSAANRVWLNR